MKLIGIVISSLIFISSAHALDLTAQSGEKVYFRGWQYRTDIVQSNIDRYNNEMIEHHNISNSLYIIPITLSFIEINL